MDKQFPKTEIILAEASNDMVISQNQQENI
jgi:hypothetical protein